MTLKTRTAEYVFPGHPDKLCDAIADTLVQETGRLERRGLCGVEVAVHCDHVFITGQVACDGAEDIDLAEMVRDVYRTAGYDDTWSPSPQDLVVELNLCRRPLHDGEETFRAVADDQTISTGYAVDLPGTNYLPPEHWLAWQLRQRLVSLPREQPDLCLGPDGKLIVVLAEDSDCLRLDQFSLSVQQDLQGDTIALDRVVTEWLEEELERAASRIPGLSSRLPEEVIVNGAGNFAVGGPAGDNGLSGKKLVVDAYGPRVPIGGGALSGKDFYKADRAGAIIARRIAKAVVISGTASECTVTVAFFPGDDEARVLSVRDQDGQWLDGQRWRSLFDLSLAGSGDRYTGSCDLVEVARNGHFTDPDRPWERLGFDGEHLGQPPTSAGSILIESGVVSE